METRYTFELDDLINASVKYCELFDLDISHLTDLKFKECVINSKLNHWKLYVLLNKVNLHEKVGQPLPRRFVEDIDNLIRAEGNNRTERVYDSLPFLLASDSESESTNIGRTTCSEDQASRNPTDFFEDQSSDNMSDSSEEEAKTQEGDPTVDLDNHENSGQASAAPVQTSRIGREVPYGTWSQQPKDDDRKEDGDEDSTLKASTSSKPSIKVRPDPLPPSSTPTEQEEAKGAQLSPVGSQGSGITCQEAEDPSMEETGAKLKDTNPLNQDVGKRRKPPFPPKAKDEMLKGVKVNVPMEYLKQINSLEDEHKSFLMIINGEVEVFTRLYSSKSMEYPSTWYEEKYHRMLGYLKDCGEVSGRLAICYEKCSLISRLSQLKEDDEAKRALKSKLKVKFPNMIKMMKKHEAEQRKQQQQVLQQQHLTFALWDPVNKFSGLVSVGKGRVPHVTLFRFFNIHDGVARDIPSKQLDTGCGTGHAATLQC